jgi:hypothetical protein
MLGRGYFWDSYLLTLGLPPVHHRGHGDRVSGGLCAGLQGLANAAPLGDLPADHPVLHQLPGAHLSRGT